MPSERFWSTLRNGFKRVCTLPFLLLVRFYQYCISPFTPPFVPLHAHLLAVCRGGPAQVRPIKGIWLTIKRLSRCHPWGGSGYDPVP